MIQRSCGSALIAARTAVVVEHEHLGGFERTGIGGTGTVVEETELAEQRSLVEHGDERLTAVGRPGQDGDASADDPEELVGVVAASEEHFVASDAPDGRRRPQRLQCFRWERTEELGRFEDASLGHDIAKRSDPRRCQCRITLGRP